MTEAIKLAGGVLLNEDNEVLLLHRSTKTLMQWEMPGGKSKVNESPEATMRRELHEEIGVHVELAQYLAQTSFRQAGKQYEYHWFKVATSDSPRIMEPDVHDELHYFALFRLRRMTAVLSPNMLAFLKQLNDGEIRLEA
jgi:mutator protein MutT